MLYTYLQHMKYVHPDIVVGEPIPEIEPRVNEVVLAHTLAWTRGSRWVVAVLFVLVVGFTIFRVSMTVRYFAVGVFYFGFMAWVFRPSMRELRKSRKKHAADKWSIPLGVAIKFLILLGLIILLLLILLMADNGISGLSSYIGMMALFIGGALIHAGRNAREPGQVCCVDCEYPLVGLTIPCECPECGRMIYDPSWTTDRPRVRSGWFMWGGVFAMAFGGLIFYSSFANPGLMYGPMPRGVLLQLAPTEKGAFNQLIRRPMDQSQTDELIERLIAGNEGKGGWDFNTNDQQRWLSQFAGTGRVSRDQYERMFGRVADWVRIELVKTPGNKIVKVGKEAEVRLASTRYINLPDSGVIVRYFFNGFEIGDDADPVGGLKGENYLSFLDAKVGDRSYRYVPRASFTPTQSGLVVIRARVVVVMHAVRLGVPIRWDHPDGLFETEPEWWTMIELEDTIIIEP